MSNDSQSDAGSPAHSMTLREAAERTSRSITTLRRYIRAGRLRAEKRHGRFGPEYFVSIAELVAAGLEAEAPTERPGAIAPRPRQPRAPAPRPAFSGDVVPTTLYQELQLKHEQLLVQYGMVRASGLRALDLRAESEDRLDQVRDLKQQLETARERAGEAEKRLGRELHEARLELEGRALEIAALKEKVRTLEILTRNSVTTDSIEQQYRDVVERTKRVRSLATRADWSTPSSASPAPVVDEPDH